MKNIILLFSIIILFSCGTDKIYKTTAKKNNNGIPGQSAPPDMIFIPSTEKHIPSFYASAVEEPNINYVIYLKWLSAIYGESYPEIVEKALPKKTTINSSYQHNDPYLRAYMTHPAFAYYPVVNLNFKQIDHYLSWKTDRLNETILARTGVINFNPDQKDEDNFNTEAYLIGEYEGSVIKNLYDTKTGGERRVAIGDGILFTGFRLPTEEEWDYMAQEKFQKNTIPNIKKEKEPFHPYGEDYFTLPYGRVYGDADIQKNGRNSLPLGISSYKVDSKYFVETNYNFEKEKTENKGIESIYNYNPKSYGLINMKGGVQEWVLDEHKEGHSNKGLHWKDVMKGSGFNVDSSAIKDKHGQYIPKGFLGNMRNFRFVGININNNPNEIGIYNPHIDDYYFTDEEKKVVENINSNPRTRIVKGGTAEKPSLESTSMKENEASPNVGFRTILPYSGQPVLRGYKVKWGKKQQIKPWWQ